MEPEQINYRFDGSRSSDRQVAENRLLADFDATFVSQRDEDQRSIVTLRL